MTAAGAVQVYLTRIDVLRLGEITLYDVPATITPSMRGIDVLLGMSALSQVAFEQRGNRLILRQLAEQRPEPSQSPTY